MPQPSIEDVAKTGLWNALQESVTARRDILSDAQVYRLLTDFAESHKPL